MSCEDQAAQCRNGLSSTLRSVHEYTAGSTAPHWELLHRMNGVLRASAETNFGSLDSISDLSDSISRNQHEMIAQCKNVPLLYFARSFAAVLEDVVVQLREANTTTVDEPPPCSEVDDSIEMVKKRREKGKSYPTKTPVASKARRRELQRRYPDRIFYFSPEALEGRIAISQMPCDVPREVAWRMLRQFGEIIDFYMPYKTTNAITYALAKLESNRAANEAVARLNGIRMGTHRVHVQRADFYSRRRDSLPSLLRLTPQYGSRREALDAVAEESAWMEKQPEPPSSKSTVDESAAAAAQDRPDWLDDDRINAVVELGDDRSDGSFFSID